jgi:soluble lytic murein transglycosylase
MRRIEGGCRIQWVRRAAVALLWVSAPGVAAPASAREPLSDWLLAIGRAAQAQADGDAEGAVRAARAAHDARPRGEAAARASVSLGVALLATGRPEAALQAFRGAAAAEPAAPELALRHAEALVATGRALEAIPLLERAAGEGELAAGRRARFALADALLRAGRTREGAAALERALAEAPDDLAAGRATLALAEAYRLLGEGARGVAALRALWVERPELPEAAEAGALLARWRAAGVAAAVAAPSGEDLAARAERLLWNGRAGEAWDALGAASAAARPAALPERLALLRAQILFGRGDPAAAAQAVAPLATSTDAGARRGADWILARVAARAGALEDAMARYARVGASDAPIPGLSEWRQRDVGDEAAFLAAWLPYDAGRLADAVPRLERFARENPRSRRADDARWFAAWSLYRLGRRPEAARAFARISGRGELAAAGRYWRARLAPRAQQRKLYEAAIAASDGDWYALLARARLSALGVRLPESVAPEARPLPEAIDGAAARRLDGAVALLGLGLRDAALAELDAIARGRGARPVASLVAQLAAFADDPELPFRMARDHLLATRRALRWGHPEAFADLVPPRAKAFGVDPALLRAVMRRESSFRREVRSGAGAQGLLQMIQPTAERLSAVLGLSDGLASRLHEPDANVSLGAHYLGLLLARFRDPAVAVAAYNAGPGPAAQWAAERAGMPLDAWVESIPYRETRQYVKIVLTSWELYRGLGGEPGAAVNPARKIPKPGVGVAF